MKIIGKTFGRTGSDVQVFRVKHGVFHVVTNQTVYEMVI